MRGLTDHNGAPTAALVELVMLAAARGASDIHLSSVEPPFLRVDGELVALGPEFEVSLDLDVRSDSVADFAAEAALERDGAVDFAVDCGARRVRANVYRRNGRVAACLRLIPENVPALDQLDLPPAFTAAAGLHHGLVLVTGATGNGKSTTLASLVAAILEQRGAHVVTIEDPIEFVHRPTRGLISQRALGSDTSSFAQALRHALRQDPDVILVGEMRDAETVRAALTLAETGHLVLSTLHSQRAALAIRRIVDLFPADEHGAIRAQLAEVLQAVLAQALITRIGGGRVLACELLTATTAVRALIRDDKPHQIQSQIEAGQSRSGMLSMSQSLAELQRRGSISAEVAAAYADGERRDSRKG